MIYLVEIKTIDPTTLLPDDRGMEFSMLADNVDEVWAFVTPRIPSYGVASVSY